MPLLCGAHNARREIACVACDNRCYPAASRAPTMCWVCCIFCAVSERTDFLMRRSVRGARLALRTLLGEFPLLVVFCSFTQSKVPDATIATRLQWTVTMSTKARIYSAFTRQNRNRYRVSGRPRITGTIFVNCCAAVIANAHQRFIVQVGQGDAASQSVERHCLEHASSRYPRQFGADGIGRGRAPSVTYQCSHWCAASDHRRIRATRLRPHFFEDHRRQFAFKSFTIRTGFASASFNECKRGGEGGMILA